jgi:4-amino-4-deoxy-L-arabinose transferase-like glycosyltransferase
MGVVGLYFLVRSLFGSRTALLSAVLLALEPFDLALSRVIHHDALSTTFMALSLLSFMVHLRKHRSFLYLVLSGLMAGLAFLSKSPSLFLVPFAALLSVGAYWLQKGSPWPLDWHCVAELGRDWVIWGFIAALVFALLWPAMWVDPLGTIQGVIDKASGYAASPHERGNFFLGKVGLDPGPLFYPVALLFRLTPLTLLGIGGSVLLLLGLSSKAYRNRRRIPSPSRADPRWRSFSPSGDGEEGRVEDRWHVVQMSSLWAFILLYVLFMTTGAKKFDRYLLPIFPVIDILAALGLLALGGVIWEWVKGRFDLVSCIARFRISALGLGLVLLLQAGFALPHYPYYLTYYNPLLGGIRQAARTVFVGWGEGYEQEGLRSSSEGRHLVCQAVHRSLLWRSGLQVERQRSGAYWGCALVRYGLRGLLHQPGTARDPQSGHGFLLPLPAA